MLLTAISYGSVRTCKLSHSKPETPNFFTFSECLEKQTFLIAILTFSHFLSEFLTSYNDNKKLISCSFLLNSYHVERILSIFGCSNEYYFSRFRKTQSGWFGLFKAVIRLILIVLISIFFRVHIYEVVIKTT